MEKDNSAVFSASYATGEGRGRSMPWRAWVALAVALLAMGGLNFLAIKNKTNLERLTMEQLILEKGLKVSDVVSRLLYKTQALRALIVQNQGGTDGFERVAMALMDDPAILNVLVAPGGIVSDVHPREPNLALLGFDMLGEGDGNREAIQARETGELVFGGPFTLSQGGGQALVGRLPVMMAGRGPGDPPRFWGIVSVTLKYPEALEGAGLAALEKQGFSYRIWRISPDTGRPQTIAENPDGQNPHARYIERSIVILNAEWFFRVAPILQWYEYPENWLMIAGGLCISLLIGFIVRNNDTLRHVTRALERQEGALRDAASRANEASRMKSSFLATMSHELRTPMNSVIGFSELAVNDPELPERARGYFDRIRASSTGLLRIVNNLLDIAKIEAGKVDLEAIPLDLGELFAECEATFQRAAADKGVDFVVVPPPAAAGAGALAGDPTRLRQVLFNLLSNAVKFTDRGFVLMRAETLRADERGAILRFEVKDSGIGLSSGQIARIFEPFAQADGGVTRKYGGTGLGLPITRGLVERMGGRMSVESVPGMGSLFAFELAFERPAPGPDSPLPRAEARTRPRFRGTVLVCEDNAINQEVIVEHLDVVGLEAVLAADGQAGLDAFAARRRDGAEPFVLVFMDIHMPGMDGLETARKLIDAGCRAPIVALTANVMAEDREAYRRAGMSDVLGKPFLAAELWACLRRHLASVDETPLPPPPVAPAGDLARAPRTDAAPSGPVDRVAGLARAAGNARLYARLLINFAADFRNADRDVRAALEAGDRAGAHRLAHSLKGAAATIGAGRLAEAARAVEAAFRDGVPSEERIDALALALAEALEDMANNAPPAPPPPNGHEARELDPARARMLVERLRPLLREGRAESREWIGQVRAELGPLGSDADVLADLMDRFDFDPALDTLDRIERALADREPPPNQ